MAYIGNIPAVQYASFSKQTLTADSSTTSFTLDNAVANENELEVFVNNVRQEPGSGKAYTASGTTLTMSEAPTAGDEFYCIFQGKATQTVTPGSGTVTNAMLAGSIDLTSKVTGTLPVANGGTNLTSGFANGITEADEWRLTADKTVSNTISAITTNLARTTRAGFSLLGTGMSESSGIFTFPNTGYWTVGVLNSYTTTNANRSNSVRLYVTTNNSTYYNIGASGVNVSDDGGASNSYGAIYSEYLIDVTSTTNVKVKFDTIANNSTMIYNGTTSSTSDGSSTRFMFRRIGDT